MSAENVLSREDIEARIRGMRVWARGDQRAPHKPLLLLQALGRVQRGNLGPIRWEEVDETLSTLLREFGPVRRSHHPEFPFWRLQNDGLWVVDADVPMSSFPPNTDPGKSFFKTHNARGRLPDEIVDALRVDPRLIQDMARVVLESSFPPSVHEDILAAVGLNLDASSRLQPRRRRDAAFRGLVLMAYEQRCAVCGLDVRLGGSQLGLEAAHIKWHQAGGPDIVPNAFAFCVLHHKFFDRGAFTVDGDRQIILSKRLHGSAGFEDVLLRYHGQPIREPQSPADRPQPEFLQWHQKEVFQRPGRYLAA